MCVLCVCACMRVYRLETAEGDAISGGGLDRRFSKRQNRRGSHRRWEWLGISDSEQAREQAQVHVGDSGSKGPLGRSTVLLAHKDNVSEGGYDGSMGLGWAGEFTETGDSGSQRTSQHCVCVSWLSGLCGLCGLALNGWLGWKRSAASMTGKTAIGKEVERDGGLFLLNHEGP